MRMTDATPLQVWLALQLLGLCLIGCVVETDPQPGPDPKPVRHGVIAEAEEYHREQMGRMFRELAEGVRSGRMDSTESYEVIKTQMSETRRVAYAEMFELCQERISAEDPQGLAELFEQWARECER